MNTTRIAILTLVISLFSCSNEGKKAEHEIISEPVLIEEDTLNYHDIGHYSPERGELPELDDANDLMHDGFYTEAIEKYAIAEKEIGFHPDIYLNRAHCYSKLDQYSLAIEDNSKLIEYDTLYYPAYMNRGMNYLDSGLFEFALKDFHSSIKLASERPESYVNMGITFIDMNLVDSACWYFNYADSLDVEDKYKQIDQHIRSNCSSINELLLPPL